MLKIFIGHYPYGSLIRLILTGFGAGVANGLLGAGGGILTVYGMSPLAEKNGIGGRDVFANALCVMMPISIVSLVLYVLEGRVPQAEFWPILLPCALGGALGALLLDRINPTVLQKLFGIIVIWSGAVMLF